MITKLVGSVVGAVTAGIGSAVCCSGPVVAASLGISGAGLLAFRPYRPLFVFVAVAFLWTGFYLLDREDQAAWVPGQTCVTTTVRKRIRISLWVATAVVLLFGTSARWLPWIL